MQQGLLRDKVLAICGISKHQFYHQTSGGKRGRKASVYTLLHTDEGTVQKVANKEVIAVIKAVYDNDPLVDYGYRRMSLELQLMGYEINHKKVYRLMKSAHLLQAKAATSSKNYVQYRIVAPCAPYRLMAMDIKQVWIRGENRKAYILSIIDVFSRVILYWTVAYSIRQADVQQAWQYIIDHYLTPAEVYAWEVHIEIRSDNGPQFCAKKLRKFLKDNYFCQTFTHPYTPQENGHIESFHAILNRMLQGQYFDNLQVLTQYLNTCYWHYNYERIHSGSLGLPPVTFFLLWKAQMIDRQVLDEKKRKVKFSLKIPRYTIRKIRPSGNECLKDVLSLDLKDFDSPKIQITKENKTQQQAKTQLGNPKDNPIVIPSV